LASHPYTNPYTGETVYGYRAFVEELATNPNIGWNDDFTKKLLSDPDNISEHEMLIAMRNLAKNNPTVRNEFSKAFDKGGIFDFGTSMNIIKYLYSTSMLGSPEEQFKAFQTLAKESYKVLDNTVNLEVEHKDKNGNGKIDAGEMVLTVIVKDQYGNEMKKETLNAEFN
jgi:Ca2+-binding EF-hand superfamily protein